MYLRTAKGKIMIRARPNGRLSVSANRKGKIMIRARPNGGLSVSANSKRYDPRQVKRTA